MFQYNQNSNTFSSTSVSESKLLAKSFSVAAIGFLVILVIGLITTFVVRNISGLNFGNGTAFDWDGIYGPKAAKTFLTATFIAMALIIISTVFSLVWTFRFMKSSKAFIITALTVYSLGQGIGFGLLFTIWNASELISIFGVATLLFGAMAIFGLVSKKIAGLGKFLVVASIFLIVSTVLSLVLFLFGVYSDSWMLILNIVGGILMMLYIAWDVHVIKRTQQYLDASGDNDKVMQFRLVTFFGFRLLSDFITMIWYLLRIYARLKR